VHRKCLIGSQEFSGRDVFTKADYEDLARFPLRTAAYFRFSERAVREFGLTRNSISSCSHQRFPGRTGEPSPNSRAAAVIAQQVCWTHPIAALPMD